MNIAEQTIIDQIETEIKKHHTITSSACDYGTHHHYYQLIIKHTIIVLIVFDGTNIDYSIYEKDNIKKKAITKKDNLARENSYTDMVTTILTAIDKIKEYHCMAYRKNGQPCTSTTGAGPIRAKNKTRWLCLTHRHNPETLTKFQGHIDPYTSTCIWAEENIEE